ncbi:tetratricopeptide repeat-containing diguanylate cyclase [Dictyoglomus thermophilum]|uniref:diguanylate cyclase n=1 Tax=Dictyoglomus thermophilum (strain ATCC 35947 / DSM 3960 / H-6-12) TaxID=309799 RepID=B5YCT8_DICT6|nr:GGDEF domain-containing protein [Dictyoglomus thermophilum]ACI19734.1 diguanylate cyclase (ggdef) domain protein [Dictyoglomus thermophilum H-6-12]
MDSVLENLNYIEEVLKKEPIVYLNLPTGSGRTYLLKSFFERNKSSSLFTHYASHRTPVGEFFITLLSLIDKNSFLKEKGDIVGPILRRYIHPRFLSHLEKYKAEEVISLDVEVAQIADIASFILEKRKIKYWIFDNWQEFLYYGDVFKELIPYLSKKYNMAFVITGKDFNMESYEIKIDDLLVPLNVDTTIKEMEKAFNLDNKEAVRLFEMSNGNWNNAIVIYKNDFKSLWDIVWEKINSLSENEKKALYTLTFVGKTFSSTTVKAVKELYGPLKFIRDFVDSKLMRWEYPLWRFVSEDVLNYVRESMPYNFSQLKEEFVKKLSSFNYSDIWGRVALLSEEDEKYWKYAKIKEFRSSYNIQRKMEILEEIVEKGKDDGNIYKRRLINLLIDFQKFNKAINIIEFIEDKNLLDLANKVRCLSYLGKYEEAEKLIEEIIDSLEMDYNLPQILSRIVSYHFLTKKVTDALFLLNKYLEDILRLTSSPKYLANFYNALGLLNLIDGKFEKAISVFENGLVLAEKSGDKVVLHKLLNNLGDLRNYLYGPKSAVIINQRAYDISKSLSKNLMVISLGNLIKSKMQYSNLKEVEDLLLELERLVSEIELEYFLYSGYRRLAIAYLNYGKREELDKVIKKLEDLKTISESKILVRILRSFFGEIEITEEEVLETKEEQIMTLYMKLVAEKGLRISKSLRDYPTDYPIHNFLKGYILGESFFNLISYIDLMLERWEFLDAFYSYKLLMKNLERDKNLKVFVPYIKLEVVGLAILLGLEKELEDQLKEISLDYTGLIKEHSKIKALEDYVGKAIMDSETEEEAMELIYRVISDFIDNFLVVLRIGDRTLKRGNELIATNKFRFFYKKPPFSVSVYSLKNLSPSLFFVIRNLLKSFIVFWERKYGIFDPLTGLFNRSYGERRLEEAFLDFVRENEDFSIIFIDIDGFKKINDTLGHSYGDYVLKEIATAIRNSIRQSDSAVRWGGDEFLILLRRADYNEAMKVVNRIKDRIESVSKGEIRISYGIETTSKETSSYRELIDRADVKMYAHKFRKLKDLENSKKE